MSRTVASLALAFLLAGCQGSTSQGPVDPFLGPTRVPPPPTGSVDTPPPDSYYQSPPQHVPPQHVPPHPGGAHSAHPSPAMSAQHDGRWPAQSGAALPSEGWSATPNFSGATLVSEAATPDMRPQQDPQAAAAATVNREPIVRILEPPARAAPPPSPTSHSSTPARVVNIVNLPKVDGAAASGFRTVSATEAGDSAGAVVPAVAEQPAGTFAPAAGQYGFDPSYAWLRGKLEYSQVDRRWKLRYIPLDGPTDEYGGSVVIANEAALAGCERSDFVAVRGRVTRSHSGHGFAPLYEVTALERLSR